jgi:branched-chain amino acid transport system permease protein
MSAARWRRAMNSSAASVARTAGGAGSRGSTGTGRNGMRLVDTGPNVAHGAVPPGEARWRRVLGLLVTPRYLFTLIVVLLYPLFATPFFAYQIGAQALGLGLIALSLTFLGGYGGMVSLAQMTVAGVAGYLVAIFGTSSATAISLGWPWWLGVIFAVSIATVFAAAVGWLSVRTEGIYTIMITLAIGVAFFYLAQQNYTLFNGFQGFNKVTAPTVGDVDFREAVPFYYLALACALGGYALVRMLVQAPFGLALQGVRDNPRRMGSLGFHVNAHRVAAYAVAGFMAAVGGVLMVWYNGRISPGSVNVAAMINILIIAVLGGMRHPIGAFVGAIVFVLLQNFAIDLVDRERFNLVIGGVFLAIVLFSPDGLLGLWAKFRSRFGPGRSLTTPPRRQA